MRESFAPRFAGWAARARESFDRQGMMAHLGARIVALTPGHCAIELDWRPELTQQLGWFHAGATSAIADSAGGFAGYTLFEAATTVVTVEYKLNLLSPGRGVKLRAEGQVVKPGRTLCFTELRVLALDADGVATLCATGQQTLYCLPETPAR